MDKITQSEFIGISIQLFTDWLNYINQLIKNGSLTLPYDYSFTNILNIAESPTHFICEINGSKKFSPNEKYF